MRITKMRIKGEKPQSIVMTDILHDIKRRLAKEGFITGVEVASNTSLKIGLWMKSFILDTKIWDRNLQCNPYQQKLTTIPNWDQRVTFNNIINSVLNKYKVSANVKSGPYTIRRGTECMNEHDWYDQKPDWIRQNESRGYYIETIDEKQFLEERRIARNKKAAEKRRQAEQRVAQRPHLSLVGGQ